MATTTDDTDYMGRALMTPDTNARDYIGRAILEGDVDYLGRATVETGAEPEAEVILEDDFTGTNAAAWNSTNWPVQRNGGITIQDNHGQIVNVSGAWAISALDVTDFDLLVKISSTAALAGRNPEIGWRLSFGVDATGENPSDGYYFQAATTDGGKVTLYRGDDTTPYNTVTAAAATELNAVVDAWFRVRAVGSAHKIRWWLDGDTEPGTWQIEATDANYATGKLMFRCYSSTAVWFDDLTVTEV